MLWSYRTTERGDKFLSYGIERWIGDLREELSEVIEEKSRLGGKCGDRGIGAHRTDRFGATLRHRREDDAKLFLGVTKGALTTDYGCVRIEDVFTRRKIRKPHDPGIKPFTVRCLRRQAILDLVILDDTPFFYIDEEHLSGLKSTFALDSICRDLQDSHFTREDDHPVIGDPESRWS